jgi:hypothetical protein
VALLEEEAFALKSDVAQATKENARNLTHAKKYLKRAFADLLEGLVFDDQVMDWIVEAFHQSYAQPPG